MRRLALVFSLGALGCGGGGCSGSMQKVTSMPGADVSGSGQGTAATSTGGSESGGSGAGSSGTGGQVVGSSGCPLFTPDDVWNKDVSGSPVDATNTMKKQKLQGAVNIHPDFGRGFGIPI